MRDSSRVTAEMMFDMISPTRLMIVCRLHRAARPCSRCCLHGYMSKQRASARIAARGEAKRAPCAAVQRFGRGDVSGVKRAAAGRAARQAWRRMTGMTGARVCGPLSIRGEKLACCVRNCFGFAPCARTAG